MYTSFEKFLAPVKELNELTMKSFEQIAEIQVKVITENAKAGVEALKSSAEIKDLDSMKSYMEDQMASAKSLSEYAVEDLNQIVSLGKDYVSDVKVVVDKSIAA